MLDDGLHAIDGIALRLGGTFLVETHQLAPKVLRLVGHEASRLECREGWQYLGHVGQFCLGEIRMSVLLIACCKDAIGSS